MLHVHQRGRAAKTVYPQQTGTGSAVCLVPFASFSRRTAKIQTEDVKKVVTLFMCP